MALADPLTWNKRTPSIEPIHPYQMSQDLLLHLLLDLNRSLDELRHRVDPTKILSDQELEDKLREYLHRAIGQHKEVFGKRTRIAEELSTKAVHQAVRVRSLAESAATEDCCTVKRVLENLHDYPDISKEVSELQDVAHRIHHFIGDHNAELRAKELHVKDLLPKVITNKMAKWEDEDQEWFCNCLPMKYCGCFFAIMPKTWTAYKVPFKPYYNLFRLRTTYFCFVTFVLVFSGFAGILIESFMSAFTELQEFFKDYRNPKGNPSLLNYNYWYFIALPIFVIFFSFFCEGVLELAMDAMSSTPICDLHALLLQGLKWMTWARYLMFHHFVSCVIAVSVRVALNSPWFRLFLYFGCMSFFPLVETCSGVDLMRRITIGFAWTEGHWKMRRTQHKHPIGGQCADNIMYVLRNIKHSFYVLCRELRDRVSTCGSTSSAAEFWAAVRTASAFLWFLLTLWGVVDQSIVKETIGMALLFPVTFLLRNRDEQMRKGESDGEQQKDQVQDDFESPMSPEKDFNTPEKWARRMVDWLVFVAFEGFPIAGGLTGMAMHGNSPDGRGLSGAFVRSYLWGGLCSIAMMVWLQQFCRMICSIDMFLSKLEVYDAKDQRAKFAKKRVDQGRTWKRMFERYKTGPLMLAHMPDELFTTLPNDEMGIIAFNMLQPHLKEDQLSLLKEGKAISFRRTKEPITASLIPVFQGLCFAFAIYRVQKAASPEGSNGQEHVIWWMWIVQIVVWIVGLLLFTVGQCSRALPKSMITWIIGGIVAFVVDWQDMKMQGAGGPTDGSSPTNLYHDVMWISMGLATVVLVIPEILHFVMRFDFTQRIRNWPVWVPLGICWVTWIIFCWVTLVGFDKEMKDEGANTSGKREISPLLCPLFLVVAWITAVSFAEVVPHSVGNPFWVFNIAFSCVFAALLIFATVNLSPFGAAVTVQGQCNGANCTKLTMPRPNGYHSPLCTERWGFHSPEAELTAIDLAQLAGLTYEKNCSDMDGNLSLIFPPDGPRQASRVYCNDYDDFPRIVIFDIGTKNKTTRVVAFKGTSTLMDMYRDATFWSTIKVLQWFSHVLPVMDLFDVGQIQWFLKRFHLYGQVKAEHEFWTNITNNLLSRGASNSDGRRVVFTGHSLGGALAQIVAARMNKPGLAFSGIGIGYSASRFGIHEPGYWDKWASSGKFLGHWSVRPVNRSQDFGVEALKARVVNVVPQFDAVPRIDQQLSTVLPIECRESDVNTSGTLMSSLSCHSLKRTECEVFRMCGDPHKRKFACDDVSFYPGDYDPYYSPDDIY